MVSTVQINQVHCVITGLLTEGFFLFFFFCFFKRRFRMVIRFFHPRHNGQRPPTSKGFSIPDLIHYIYFPILILEKEPVFPF